MVNLRHVTETIFVASVQLIELVLEFSRYQCREHMTLIVLGRCTLKLDLNRCLQLLLKKTLIADKRFSDCIVGNLVRLVLLASLPTLHLLLDLLGERLRSGATSWHRRLLRGLLYLWLWHFDGRLGDWVGGSP